MSAPEVWYESYGCQMNAYDTEVIEAIFSGRGWKRAAGPESADVIVVNTCSVREHAETRAIGRLHDLARHGNAVIAVCGCMARRIGTELFEIEPRIRIVAGPDAYDRLAGAVEEALSGGGTFALLERDHGVTYRLPGSTGEERVTRYLSITRGCENFCTYCIVPYLRGPVRSKSPETVVHEVVSLAQSGAREVTLLGQNVMAYDRDGVDFPGLIARILRETDVPRIRFLTTHPRDVDRRIFELMANDPRVCPHLHLPFQAGSDRLLELMNRGYRRSDYLAIVEEGRRIRPDIAFTTDVIVGFPTETRGDFEETLDIVEQVRFDAAFTFRYSPRAGTAAADMVDDVPDGEKRERLAELNESVRRIRGEILAGLVGTETEILLDASVEKGETRYLKGRTVHFRNVLVPAEGLRVGDFARVKPGRLRNFTLIGEVAAGR
ncbi:MAG: tRNA (N6-isopentenyl adenosine(37)-C2)-methylthiotransferase MiaB [Candidatus Krumholzibacteriota bacterium]|nr:tRNA (N6-isopentenyl adenosine(37)-C2)-methylthiotransferase MiaB [Candidatus Krumholzibacteriota bacterium]